jgi:hypothetical protein
VIFSILNENNDESVNH